MRNCVAGADNLKNYRLFELDEYFRIVTFGESICLGPDIMSLVPFPWRVSRYHLCFPICSFRWLPTIFCSYAPESGTERSFRLLRTIWSDSNTWLLGFYIRNPFYHQFFDIYIYFRCWETSDNIILKEIKNIGFGQPRTFLYTEFHVL